MAGYDDWKTTDPDDVSARDYAHAESAIREWYDDWEFELRHTVDIGVSIQNQFCVWLASLDEHVRQGVSDRERLVEREGLACDTDDGNVDEYLLDDLRGAYEQLAEFVAAYQTKTNMRSATTAMSR